MTYPVLHLLETAQPRGTGIARIVLALAAGLDSYRYALEACFVDGDGPLAEEFQEHGIPAHIVRWSGGARDPVGAMRFMRSLRGRQYSIIHQHFGGRSMRLVARRMAHAKILVHLHERIIEERGPIPITPVIDYADAVIANSRATAARVHGIRPDVVYAGVQVPQYQAAKTAQDEERIVIGTAGRLVPIKGIVYLLRALNLLHDQFPGLHLEIAGEGCERAALENEVKSMTLQRRVRFLGWQSELSAAFDGWNIFVLPSLEESFGISILEAMAYGLPVIASDVGGIPEVVEHGRSGWLVPPRSPEALAERLKSMLVNPDERRAFGSAARERVRANFSAQRMVSSISKVYDRLMTGG